MVVVPWPPRAPMRVMMLVNVVPFAGVERLVVSFGGGKRGLPRAPPRFTSGPPASRRLPWWGSAGAGRGPAGLGRELHGQVFGELGDEGAWNGGMANRSARGS